MFSTLVQHLNDYAMVTLVVTVAMSSVIRVLRLDQTAVGSRILAVCFDLGGAIRGYQEARKSPEAK